MPHAFATRVDDRRAARLGFGLLLLVLVAATSPLLSPGAAALDPDLFWHLRVAETLLDRGVGPVVDNLSFNSIGRPWSPYSWAAELLMLALWNAAGPAASVAVTAVTAASFTAFCGLACAEAARRSGTGPARLSAAAAASVAAVLGVGFFALRPVAMALPLLALSQLILWRDRRLPGGSRLAWGLPLVTAVCVNLHLYAIFIPALAAIRAVDGPGRRPWVVAILCGLACGMTPLLPGVLATAWHYHAADPMVDSGLIVEMRPFWHGTGGTIRVGLVAAFAAAVAWRWRRLTVGDWLSLVLATALLLRFVRFTPVFALIAAPVVAAALPPVMGAVLGRAKIRVALALLAGMLLSVAAWQTSRPTLQSTGYPSAAASWVGANVPPRTGRLVNTFTHGGYLAWRLPDRQTFVDGRTQLFDADFWRDAYLRGPAPRRRLLVAAGADAAILPADEPHFRRELLALGWRVVLEDAEADVLLPPRGGDGP